MEALATTERAAVGLIKNDDELKTAGREFDRLMDLGDDRTPYEEDMYDLLALVIEYYESLRFPRVETDPIRQIKFAMDQQNLRQRDMIKYFGSRSRASEVLNYKRKLTLKMMRKLHKGIGIPLEILVRDYELAK